MGSQIDRYPVQYTYISSDSYRRECRNITMAVNASSVVGTSSQGVVVGGFPIGKICSDSTDYNSTDVHNSYMHIALSAVLLYIANLTYIIIFSSMTKFSKNVLQIELVHYTDIIILYSNVDSAIRVYGHMIIR